jgi:hypothetical protein
MHAVIMRQLPALANIMFFIAGCTSAGNVFYVLWHIAPLVLLVAAGLQDKCKRQSRGHMQAQHAATAVFL